jgi:tripartite-type tricarboxylate transporter receptor subunit TctC
MPAETVARYNTLINEILRSPDIADKLAKQSIGTVGGTAEQLRQFIADDMVKWSKTIKDAGIAAE